MPRLKFIEPGLTTSVGKLPKMPSNQGHFYFSLDNVALLVLYYPPDLLFP